MLLAVGNRENYRNVVLTTADLREAYRQMGCPAVPWSSWDYIDRKAHLALAAKVGAQVGGMLVVAWRSEHEQVGRDLAIHPGLEL